MSRLSRLRDEMRVKPGSRVDLSKIDPADDHGWRKDDADAETTQQLARLSDLQDRFWAEAKRSVLVVLQGIDAAGKDGTIRKVIGELNPAGVNIVSFGVPTPEERRHHFLWRVRRAVPGPGYVGVFNRSHYEDVLVARVHRLVPGGVWKRRYGQINNFERALVDDHVTVLKVMLHVSYEEQRRRLLARLDDPTKHWKYNPGDVDERRLWPDYQAAYADALGRCSTDHAPWYVVPADHKWYRNWAVAHLLRETFADLDPRYPSPDFDVEAEKARVKAA